MNEYVSELKKFSDFSGRTGKREFWYFILISIAISIVLSFVGSIIGTVLISTLFSLITIVPIIAIWVRKMHDINKEWWYFLIPLYNLYLALQDGDQGDNQYGSAPTTKQK